jgi:replicative DNA helicase
VQYPSRHLGSETDQFAALMGEEQRQYFARFGVSAQTLQEMRIGFNGRYLVYPYIQESGYAYAAHCLLPGREQDHFWHGHEDFSKGAPAVYNAREIGRCESGALFVTDGELSLLILKALGYPAIAVASAAGLAVLAHERLERIEHLLLLVANTPEARLAAREFAVRVGFKARILTWPTRLKRGGHLAQLAADAQMDTRKTVQRMIQQSKAFSPFGSPEKERRRFSEFLDKEKGKTLMGIQTGFAKMDRHLEGLRGLNILGGPPKPANRAFSCRSHPRWHAARSR